MTLDKLNYWYQTLRGWLGLRRHYRVTAKGILFGVRSQK